MNDEILDSIAKDLKIDTLKSGLSSTEYRCAVLYSASALWAKTSSQDILDNTEIGSRKHVIHICSSFINKSLEDENDDVKQFFVNNEHDPEKSAAVKLIDALIRVREFSETGNDPNSLKLSLPSDKTIQLTHDYQAAIGFLGTEGLNHNKEYKLMSGLAFIVPGESDAFPSLINNEQWVKQKLSQLQSLKPTRTKSTANDLYFDIRDYGDRRFSRHKPHENYPFEIVMNNTVAGEQYYLKMNESYYLFSDFSITLKEHHRFMIYLVSKLNGKMMNLRNENGVIHLDLYLSLPIYEDSLLRLVFWPRRTIDDSGSFFGPSFLKLYVSDILSSLGLKYDKI